jgi:rhomboid protease GluP
MPILKKFQYNSPVILSYFLISFVVLVLNNMTNGMLNYLLFSVYRSSFGDLLTYFRVFGHVIGHANYEHFINNFIMILLIGPPLEEKYGSKNLLLVMAITAFITGVFHKIISPGRLLGASGIVFMFIILSSFTNFKRGKIPITLIFIMIMFIGREISSAMGSTSNVSYITHILGGMCGALLGFLLNMKQNKV